MFSWDAFKGGIGVFRVSQHKPISTKGMSIDKVEYLKDKTFDIIYNALADDEVYMKDTNRKK